jgi:hypothetical protein
MDDLRNSINSSSENQDLRSQLIQLQGKISKMYSKEDMRKMYDNSCGLVGLGLLDDQTENNNRFNELLDQFKNK